MKTLKEIIIQADSEKKGIGHFNISTIEVLFAIFEAAQEHAAPVIIGTSEGERKFIGIRQAVELVRSLREEFKYPIFLNADHTYSFEGVKKAVDAGYDMVIFDGASLPFEENIKITKQCVEYAKSKDQDIVVEGELGYIGKSSKLLDEVPKEVIEAGKTTPEQAREFVQKTGIDMLAPSVGNLHGVVKGAGNPDLDSELIAKIREAAGVPLVLHGGSGLQDEEFQKAIRAGMSVVHINTEIRKAWRDAIEQSLEDDPEQVAPYKILKPARDAVREIVRSRIDLFAG